MLSPFQQHRRPAAHPTSRVAPPLVGGTQGAQLALGLLSRRAPALHSDLMEALSGGQLRLHYQGQFDLRTGGLVALEALIRWAHPREGLLAPARFLPMAQDAGLMSAIDRWALQTACADGAWLAQRGHPVEIAVNVSAAQLTDRSFPASVHDVADRAGCATELLTLEIGQKDVLLDLDTASAVALELGILGIRTSISEVGAASTSDRDVQVLHADEIKIDRRLTAGVGAGPGETDDVVRGVVAAARQLRARVVIEGVETEAQYRFAREVGCDRAQGYLLERPAALEDLAHLLARRQPAPPSR